MKLLLISLSIIALFFIACDDEADKSFMDPVFTEDPNDVTPPTVTFISHTDSVTVPKDIVIIEVNATDNTEIRQVDFRINNILVGEDKVPPYQYSWDTRTLATNTHHEICAIALDNGLNTSFECVILKIGM
jgi:hypothetical protein